MEIILVASCWILLGLTIVYICQACYHNGVTDGYGYSKEPNCPGYKRAGDYLKNYMAHRWPELRDDK